MAFPALSSRSMQTPHPRRELRRLTRLFTLAGAATRDWGASDGEHIWMDPRQLHSLDRPRARRPWRDAP